MAPRCATDRPELFDRENSRSGRLYSVLPDPSKMLWGRGSASTHFPDSNCDPAPIKFVDGSVKPTDESRLPRLMHRDELLDANRPRPEGERRRAGPKRCVSSLLNPVPTRKDLLPRGENLSCNISVVIPQLLCRESTPVVGSGVCPHSRGDPVV